MRKLLEAETLLSEKEIENVLAVGTWTKDIEEFIIGCDLNGFFDESEDAEADKESMREDYENGSWGSDWGVATDSILVGEWIVSRQGVEEKKKGNKKTGGKEI